MHKIAPSDLKAVIDPHPDLTGVTVKEVVNRTSVDGCRGMFSIAEFAPGGCHQLHRHPASDQISYLMAGVGEHLTADGPIAVQTGDTVHIPRNEWHGFHNTGQEKAVLLSMYSPAAHLSEAGYETFDSSTASTQRQSEPST